MSKKPVFGYKGMVFATLSIAGLSMGVWAHHMYTTGAVLLPFFAALTLLIAVPTGIKFFNWIGTMWRGTITFNTADAVRLGFLLHVPLRRPHRGDAGPARLDFQLHNTYFVVAHFHYVMFGGRCSPCSPRSTTGTPSGPAAGSTSAWAGSASSLLFIGFNLIFFPQHHLGLRGMPRRIETYAARQRLELPQHAVHHRRLYRRARACSSPWSTCFTRSARARSPAT